MTVGLATRPLTRAGWLIFGLVTAGFGGLTLVVAISTVPSRPAAIPVTVLLGVLYGFFGLGALRMAAARGAQVTVDETGLTVSHPGVLGAPLHLPAENIDAVLVDPRARPDRRAAATSRRGGVVPPTFLSAALPVVSDAPSSHSRDGTAVPPNVVVVLRSAIDAPPVPWTVRACLRLSTGKSGRYQGPRPGRPLEGVRLVADDAFALAEAVSAWDVLRVEPRDVRYLGEVTERHRWLAARKRLLIAGGGTALGLALLLPRIVSTFF